jgi:hypothetical protein
MGDVIQLLQRHRPPRRVVESLAQELPGGIARSARFENGDIETTLTDLRQKKIVAISFFSADAKTFEWEIPEMLSGAEETERVDLPLTTCNRMLHSRWHSLHRLDRAFRALRARRSRSAVG